MAGFFNGVGGHIEFEEGIVESAEREILEETGLRPAGTSIKGIVHFMNFFGKNTIVFVTVSQSDTAEVVESDEGKLHWIPLDKLDEINLIEDVTMMLDKINSLKDGEIFTAVCHFDGGAKVLDFRFE